MGGEMAVAILGVVLFAFCGGLAFGRMSVDLWPSEGVKTLELQLARSVHKHRYAYSKHLTDGSPFWSWKCLDGEGEISRSCSQPSGGTNYQGGLPDHFPDVLR